jgi:hypothetical protein
MREAGSGKLEVRSWELGVFVLVYEVLHCEEERQSIFLGTQVFTS